MHPWSETSLIGSLLTRTYGKVSIVAKGARRPKSPFEAALDLLSVCRVVFIAKSGDALSILTEAKLQNRFHPVGRDLLRLYAAYYVAELLEKFTEPGSSEPQNAKQGVDHKLAESKTVGSSLDVPVEASSLAELFDLASDTLRRLEQPECEVRAVVLRFELQLLRLTGHRPSLSRCVHCGSQIASSKWLIYGPVVGGVMCPGCSAGNRLLMRIPNSVIKVLQQFIQNDWRSIPLNDYTRDGRAVIRAMMVKTFTGLLDQRLKLHPYLEELGR